MRVVAVLVVALMALALAGCAGVVERSDRMAERVGNSVHDYCETTEQEDRDALRLRVNEWADPHAVEVMCDE